MLVECFKYAYFRLLAVVVFVVYVGFLLAPPVYCQENSVSFNHLTVDDGLSHNNVIVINQDRYGFLWFGTEIGLNVYDGYSIRVFKNELGNPRSLSNNWIYDIYEDRAGRLWIGTEDGVNLFDRDSQTFERFLSSSSPIGPVNRDILAIEEDKEGRLLLGTRQGLYRYDPATDDFQVFEHELENTSSLSGNYVSELLIDRENRLWVGGDAGLNLFDSESGAFRRFQYSSSDQNSLSSNSIRKIFQDSEGTIWVGTGQGLNRFDEASGAFLRVTGPGGKGPVSVSQIEDIFEDGMGRIWISTRGNGLYRFDKERNSFTKYVSDPGDPTSLSTDRIQPVYEDHSGVLWIGTADKGLDWFDEESGSFGLIRHDRADASSLTDNDVLAIEGDWRNPDVIWIGTRFGGLNRYDGASNRYTSLKVVPRGSSDAQSDVIESILVDRAGTLWVGTYGGLGRFDEPTRSFTYYLNDFPDRLARWKRIIYEAPSEPGVLWLASGKAGLIRFDVRSETHQIYSYSPDDSLSLSAEWVSAIFEDSEGRLWIGTERGGLNLFNRETEAFTHFQYDPDKPYSLASQNVFAINQARDGTLWLGTGDGLVRFDPAIPRFEHFTVSSSDLPNNTIYNILFDDEDKLWLSTLGGLSRFDPDAESFSNYDLDRGLQSRAFNPFAAYKNPSGEMYFGGPGGLNAFYPGEINDNPHPPRVVLTDFKLFNESIIPGEQSLLKHSIASTDKIELAHDQNDVIFNYVGLHYSNPGRIEYAYKLDPYDADWRQVSGQRAATYTSLPPGDYTFYVKARSADGVWSEPYHGIQLLIHWPWWQTTWAYVLYSLAFGLGILTIDRIQRRRLINKERARARVREIELRAEAAELQANVNESEARALRAENERKAHELLKAEELKHAYNALEASMDELKRTQRRLIQAEKMASLGQLTAGIAHELKNPLNFVTNFAKLASDSVTELTNRLTREDKQDRPLDPEEVDILLETLAINTKQIEKHGQRADHIVSSMMEHARGEVGQRDGVKINTLLDQFINLAYHGQQARDQNFQVDIVRNFDPNVGEVEILAQDVGRVLINLLDNSFYSVLEKKKRLNGVFKPEVCVSTRKETDCVIIQIADNGIGIPKDAQKKIFEPFYTTKPTGMGSVGLGLYLSYEIIVEGHGGELNVESEEGQGASMIIKLPLNPE